MCDPSYELESLRRLCQQGGMLAARFSQRNEDLRVIAASPLLFGSFSKCGPTFSFVLLRCCDPFAGCSAYHALETRLFGRMHEHLDADPHTMYDGTHFGNLLFNLLFLGFKAGKGRIQGYLGAKDCALSYYLGCSLRGCSLQDRCRPRRGLAFPLILRPTAILQVTKRRECVCPTRSSLRILCSPLLSLDAFLLLRKLNQLR